MSEVASKSTPSAGKPEGETTNVWLIVAIVILILILIILCCCCVGLSGLTWALIQQGELGLLAPVLFAI